MQLRQRTVIEEMTLDDIPAVQEIEKEIFLTPWPRNAYRRELSQNQLATYIVLREEDEIIGYAGLWKMHDEAHITTVGVRRRDQGKGFGMALMLALIERAYAMESRWMTLEVRASNHGAMTSSQGSPSYLWICWSAARSSVGTRIAGRSNRSPILAIPARSASLSRPSFPQTTVPER